MRLLVVFVGLTHALSLVANGVPYADGDVDDVDPTVGGLHITGAVLPGFLAGSAELALSSKPLVGSVTEPIMDMTLSGFVTSGPVSLQYMEAGFDARPQPSTITVSCNFAFDVGDPFVVSVERDGTTVLTGMGPIDPTLRIIEFTAPFPPAAAPFTLTVHVDFMYPTNGPRGAGFLAVFCGTFVPAAGTTIIATE